MAMHDKLSVRMTNREVLGAPGKSAYEIAVETGFGGTEAEWLESLKGAKGDPGEPGPRGEAGTSPTISTRRFDAGDLEAAPLRSGVEVITTEFDQEGNPVEYFTYLYDGGHYTPEVSQPEAGVLQFDFVPSVEAMPAVEPVQVNLPGGSQNVDLTDYATKQYVQEYAQPKGNYLTEHQDLSGYAKTEAVPTDAHINSLIDAKLGVIENGTY